LSGFQFKGGGWYVTDYAGKSGSGEKSEKSSDSDSTTASDGASKSKDESKPATTNGSKTKSE